MKSKIHNRAVMTLALAAVLLWCLAAAPATDDLLGAPYTRVNNNLHQVAGPAPDAKAERAFRLYRSASPSKETFAKWCGEYGIERVIVMDGSAQFYELKYQREGVCRNLQVIYNVNQGLTPVSDGFLNWFDEQVGAARRDRAGVLIRCKTGSHRTGRLAAYYQIKYQGLSADQAIAVMNHKGKMMEFWGIMMDPQVKAIDDYVHGRPCSQPGSCVVAGSEQWVPRQ